MSKLDAIEWIKTKLYFCTVHVHERTCAYAIYSLRHLFGFSFILFIKYARIVSTTKLYMIL